MRLPSLFLLAALVLPLGTAVASTSVTCGSSMGEAAPSESVSQSLAYDEWVLASQHAQGVDRNALEDFGVTAGIDLEAATEREHDAYVAKALADGDELRDENGNFPVRFHRNGTWDLWSARREPGTLLTKLAPRDVARTVATLLRAQERVSGTVTEYIAGNRTVTTGRLFLGELTPIAMSGQWVSVPHASGEPALATSYRPLLLRLPPNFAMEMVGADFVPVGIDALALAVDSYDRIIYVGPSREGFDTAAKNAAARARFEELLANRAALENAFAETRRLLELERTMRDNQRNYREEDMDDLASARARHLLWGRAYDPTTSPEVEQLRNSWGLGLPWVTFTTALGIGTVASGALSATQFLATAAAFGVVHTFGYFTNVYGYGDAVLQLLRQSSAFTRAEWLALRAERVRGLLAITAQERREADAKVAALERRFAALRELFRERLRREYAFGDVGIVAKPQQWHPTQPLLAYYWAMESPAMQGLEATRMLVVLRRAEALALTEEEQHALLDILEARDQQFQLATRDADAFLRPREARAFFQRLDFRSQFRAAKPAQAPRRWDEDDRL